MGDGTMPRLIVLSGPMTAGKSTLVGLLSEVARADVVSTRKHLTSLVEQNPKRSTLQAAGDGLDVESGGQWVVDLTQQKIADLGSDVVILDAVRTLEQIRALRREFGRAVVHLHLTAPMKDLAARYESRRASSPELEFASYEEAAANATEEAIETLRDDADVVIDTSRNTEHDVLVRAAAQLGLGRRLNRQTVDVMVGGQFGSEGKGNVAAYLAPEYQLLVRSGGPNAGHSIWTPSGVKVQHHLPSGTTVSDAKLLLTSGAVIHVEELLDEIKASSISETRLSIDPNAVVIDESHRRSEVELGKRIGSTVAGVGAATANRIYGRGSGVVLAKHVDSLRPFIKEGHSVLADHYRRGSKIFVEGTQGTGLSLLHGPYPYVTSRDTTVAGVLAEAGVPLARVRRSIMVVRAYPIRVANPDEGGTSGPLPQEISWNVVAERSGLPLDELVEQEHTTRTKRLRRVGEFSWTWIDRAVQLNGPTDIALTFADQIDSANQNARRFDQLTQNTINFVGEVESVANAPVSLISTRFHERSVIDRRMW